MTKFTFIDVEAVWDEQLHEAYREIDPRGAAKQKRKGQVLHRLPCKRVIAAAAFDLEVDTNGAISIGGLSSWTEYDHGDEREVVTQLFEHLRARPQHHVVTYNGLAAEVPLLTLAALEHELVLPEQLQTGSPFVAKKNGPWRPHIDLALELKGNGRDWAHLTEVGLRCGLPSALFAGKADIVMPSNAEQWLAMRQRVSMDCVLTAVVALAFWRVTGRIRFDQTAMLHNIASWCLRAGVAGDMQAEALSEMRRRMLERLLEQLDEAA
ncbi:hypothetical protein OIK40_04290 [Erythrobacter sp. sf7]|uniref:Predicted 3'-5' exonuclease PolB-like domain-containing protein n=1 Tax=Erythrobacter fulvus TaxID=2987523 RepID=A0ABT5JMM8_9SPHN|nr:hypothetical protein [Erythrobacter fulvus]MDC8753859.1 hypothetical protein [Erythrobacter fulvus]